MLEWGEKTEERTPPTRYISMLFYILDYQKQKPDTHFSLGQKSENENITNHTLCSICVGCKKWIGQLLLSALNVDYRDYNIIQTTSVEIHAHRKKAPQQQTNNMLIQMAHEIII